MKKITARKDCVIEGCSVARRGPTYCNRHRWLKWRYGDPLKAKRHHLCYTPEYATWQSMKTRCKYPGAAAYARYGGAGIKVCERWSSFRNFYEDMGPKPTPQHSIDRIDSKEDYAPENCRWATPYEQINNRSNTILITVKGTTLPLAEWGRRSGMKYDTLRGRLRKGVPPELLLEPLKRKRNK